VYRGCYFDLLVFHCVSKVFDRVFLIRMSSVSPSTSAKLRSHLGTVTSERNCATLGVSKAEHLPKPFQLIQHIKHILNTFEHP